MADPVWPSAPMPQRMLFQGFAAEDDDVRDTFQPDKGPPIYGPGLMMPSSAYQVSMEVPQASILPLRAFWNDDCIRGTQQFTFPEDPLTKETDVRLRFETPLRFTTIQDIADLWLVTFTVRRMP